MLSSSRQKVRDQETDQDRPLSGRPSGFRPLWQDKDHSGFLETEGQQSITHHLATQCSHGGRKTDAYQWESELAYRATDIVTHHPPEAVDPPAGLRRSSCRSGRQ